jgi:hypothetical protein
MIPSSENLKGEFETRIPTLKFHRIQVKNPQRPVANEYHDLSRPHQQQLLSRLIDHVREL